MTLTFSPRQAMVTTRTRAKDQVQRSLGSKDKEETNGHITSDFIILPAIWSVLVISYHRWTYATELCCRQLDGHRDKLAVNHCRYYQFR